MTLEEFAVLDALNIASTVEGGPGDYWGTTQGVASVLANDKRFATYPKLDSKQVGYVMRGLQKGILYRWNAPLVEVVGRRHGGARKWRLTYDGIKAISA